MKIFKSTVPHESRYFVQLGGRIYQKNGEANITNWYFSPEFFKKTIANGKIKIVTNPPNEIINEFEAFRTKLILGIPCEDI